MCVAGAGRLGRPHRVGRNDLARRDLVGCPIAPQRLRPDVAAVDNGRRRDGRGGHRDRPRRTPDSRCCGHRRGVGRDRWADAFSIATAATPHQGSIPTALNKGAILLGNWTGDEGRQRDLASVLADTHTEWSAATNGSQSAAALEISSGTSVMAIGGWSGDPVPTLRRSSTTSTREDHLLHRAGPGRRVRPNRREVIYGRNHSASHSREIADWVAGHYQGTSIGESMVYRLT